MGYRTATQADLLTIWPRLAQRMTDEYRVAGATPGQARGRFRDYIKAGTADAILDGETPVAIFGWQMVRGVMMTSFAGTDTFFEPRLVRLSVRYVIDLQARHGNCAIVSHSFSDHPMTQKWFKTVGLELRSVDGILRTFARDPR